MSFLTVGLVAAIAALHLFIMGLEMFGWQSARARSAFGVDEELASRTTAMAANQGLYNGFLAAGLIWGLLARDPVGHDALIFFLGCVAVAGVFGAATVNRRIALIQTVPAVVALVGVLRR